jgi:hypothetical protein
MVPVCNYRSLEDEKRLAPHQSIYIPLGDVHRLADPGKVWLKIIDVASGSYHGEDDIVRFANIYGRGLGHGTCFQGKTIEKGAHHRRHRPRRQLPR